MGHGDVWMGGAFAGGTRLMRTGDRPEDETSADFHYHLLVDSELASL